jgi:hypothetical protein
MDDPLKANRADWPNPSTRPHYSPPEYRKFKGKFAKFPSGAVFGGALRGIKGSTAKVWLALFAHANSRTGEAWPGTTRLAFYAGVSSRDVTEALEVLHAIRALEIKRRGLRGYTYRLTEPSPIVSLEYNGRPSVKQLRTHIADLIEAKKGKALFQSEIRKLCKVKEPALSK